MPARVPTEPLDPAGTLGLLAADGGLPLKIAASALRQNLDVRAYVASRTQERALGRILGADRVRRLKPALYYSSLDVLRADGVKRVCVAGKLKMRMLLLGPLMDARARQIWSGLKIRTTIELMRALMAELHAAGLPVVSQAAFVQDCFPPKGVLTRRAFNEQENADAEFGLKMAGGIAALDIGQSIVAARGMVLGAEGVEGTDGLIGRCARWSRRAGGVLVKTRRAGHDERYDVPTIGPETIRAMRRAGLTGLAIEAGKTIVLDQEDVVALADKAGISITVF